MPLNALEQLELIKDAGQVNATYGPDATDLQSLILQSAFIYAGTFLREHKQFDEPANELAADYLSKMVSVCRRVMSGASGVVEIMTRIVVVKIGEVAADLTQVEGANDTLWEGFVSGQMNGAFETAGIVKANEKAAYDAL